MSLPHPTDSQARIIWASLTGLGIAVLAALVAGLIWGLGIVLKVLAPVLWPLAIAGVMAYLLDPVVDFLERRKMPRQWAIVMVFVIFVAAAVGGLGSLLPRVVYEAKDLADQMPRYMEEAEKSLRNWMSNEPSLFEWLRKMLPSHSAAPPGAASATNAPAQTPGGTNAAPAAAPVTPEQVLAELKQSLFNLGGKMAPAAGPWLVAQTGRLGHWFEMIIGLALVPVFVFYFLLEKEGIEAGWTHYLPLKESRLKEELVFVLNAINNYLIVFFRGQVVIALCDAVLLCIGFLALGLNFAVLIGLMAGFLGIIPYLGTILTIVPAIILAGVQFHDLLHPILVVAIYSMVHLLEGFVIAPKIQGDRVGLHPLTIIVALLVGTTLLGGILGGILAIPFTAALRVVMFRYVWRERAMSQAAQDSAAAAGK